MTALDILGDLINLVGNPSPLDPIPASLTLETGNKLGKRDNMCAFEGD